MVEMIRNIGIIGFFSMIFSGLVVAAPINTDFESGALAPWYQDISSGGITDWQITTSSINGTYSAFDNGNKRIRQDFAGIFTDDILSITFNLLTNGHGANAYNFFYSDGSAPQFFVVGDADVVRVADVTGNLAAGKTLVGFGLWGNNGGGTTFDDLSIAVRANVPAPATLALFGLGLAGLGCSRRKKA